jgi:plastocyanin
VLLQGLLLAGVNLLTVTAYAQTLSVTLVDEHANPISGAVIELLVSDELKAMYRSQENIKVDQIDKEFVPRVSTVVVGNRVGFPNSDDILHHVYSFSPINTFNIPLYGMEDEKFSQEFPVSGIVEIGCNIHDWMLAYIYVSETSLTSVTSSTGVAVLQSAPVGSHQLRVWHPRLAEANNSFVVDVDLLSGATTNLEFSLELKRERRLRRAPSSAKKRYR